MLTGEAPKTGEALVIVPIGTKVQYFDRGRPDWKEPRLGLVSSLPQAGGKYEVAVFDRARCDPPPHGGRVESGVQLFPEGAAVLSADKWGLYEPSAVKVADQFAPVPRKR